MSRRTLFWVLFVLLLIVDQATKAWSRAAFNENQSYAVWANVFELTLTYNRGIAFGMFQGIGVLLAPVAIAIAGGSAFYSMRHPRDPSLNHIICALFASGALGNLYDRLFHGKVTDMFYVRLINFPVFNVADSCITVGAVLLFIIWVREAIDRPHESQKDPGTSETLQPSGE